MEGGAVISGSLQICNLPQHHKPKRPPCYDCKMNHRRAKFCQAYARCGVAAEAARQAGYSSRTARTIGSMLLSKSDIVALIESTKAELKAQDDALHAQVQAELKAAAIESVSVLRSVLADPDATPSARVSAALGVLVDCTN